MGVAIYLLPFISPHVGHLVFCDFDCHNYAVLAQAFGYRVGINPYSTKIWGGFSKFERGATNLKGIFYNIKRILLLQTPVIFIKIQLSSVNRRGAT